MALKLLQVLLHRIPHPSVTHCQRQLYGIAACSHEHVRSHVSILMFSSARVQNGPEVYRFDEISTGFLRTKAGVIFVIFCKKEEAKLYMIN